MISSADHHRINKLQEELFTKLGKRTHSFEEVLVVTQNVLTGVMLLLHSDNYKMTPQAVGQTMEVMLHEATKRFAAILENKDEQD